MFFFFFFKSKMEDKSNQVILCLCQRSLRLPEGFNVLRNWPFETTGHQ